MKKQYAIIVMLVFCLLLTWNVYRPGNQLFISCYVKQNAASLELVAQTALQQGSGRGLTVSGVNRIDCWRNSGSDTGMVEFPCRYTGFGPAATFKGFYYAADDMPRSFQGANMPLYPDGDGWRWQENAGDNRGYTEKICDHWYYYEARL